MRFRGCEPGVTRDGRVFRFCEQPPEVGEKVRDKRAAAPRILAGRRLRKQDQKITGLGHGFNPVGCRRGEKQVVQFPPARRQSGMVGVDRGELTAHHGRLPCGHPSSTVQIDCVFRQNLPPSASFGPTGRIKDLVDAYIHSTVRPAGRGAVRF